MRKAKGGGGEMAFPSGPQQGQRMAVVHDILPSSFKKERKRNRSSASQCHRGG